jgi:hypothetical protein
VVVDTEYLTCHMDNEHILYIYNIHNMIHTYTQYLNQYL